MQFSLAGQQDFSMEWLPYFLAGVEIGRSYFTFLQCTPVYPEKVTWKYDDHGEGGKVERALTTRLLYKSIQSVLNKTYQESRL